MACDRHGSTLTRLKASRMSRDCGWESDGPARMLPYLEITLGVGQLGCGIKLGGDQITCWNGSTSNVPPRHGNVHTHRIIDNGSPLFKDAEMRERCSRDGIKRNRAAGGFFLRNNVQHGTKAKQIMDIDVLRSSYRRLGAPPTTVISAAKQRVGRTATRWQLRRRKHAAAGDGLCGPEHEALNPTP